MTKIYDCAELSMQTFQPLIGSEFELTDASAIRLVQVDEISLGPNWQGNRQPFALIFEGVHEQPIATGIRRLTHACGEFNLSLNPVIDTNQTPGKITYEAVFS